MNPVGDSAANKLGGVPCAAPGVTRKSNELVEPTTTIEPSGAKAMAVTWSCPTVLPPKSVENPMLP